MVNRVQLVIKEVKYEDLLVTMKTVIDELKETLLFNMSVRMAVMLKENLESLGPMKISEVKS
jgi:flagellar motor switch protein FliG